MASNMLLELLKSPGNPGMILLIVCRSTIKRPLVNACLSVSVLRYNKRY